MKTLILTVSQITNSIREVIETSFNTVKVKGEISNFVHHSSGHRYFTLKDNQSQISCMMWRSRKLNFVPTNGMKVIISGKVTVYPPRGQYQIDCTSMQPVGQGDLYLAFEALKEKLEEQGYFDIDRKKELPDFPLKIAVSTSPTGAAVRDIISTIKRRMPLCEIFFRPTLVQGDAAAQDIADAITELNKTPAEVIIIGRGGGSIEDLWAYNEEIVANAIYNSAKPIISAVGHETDFTISDFVADKRAATPTAGAEIVTPVTYDMLMNNFDAIQDELITNMQLTLKDYESDIINLSNSSAFKQIPNIIATNEQLLDDFEIRMKTSINNHFQKNKDKAQSLFNHLKSLYPLSPLDKGFALLQADDQIINNNNSLDDYSKLDVIRKNEKASVTINNVEKIKEFKIN